MILSETLIPARYLQCDVCGYPGTRDKPWVSINKRMPDCCPNRACRSREWNGKKTRAVKPNTKIDLPKPVKVRGGDEDDF